MFIEHKKPHKIAIYSFFIFYLVFQIFNKNIFGLKIELFIGEQQTKIQLRKPRQEFKGFKNGVQSTKCERSSPEIHKVALQVQKASAARPNVFE